MYTIRLKDCMEETLMAAFVSGVQLSWAECGVFVLQDIGLRCKRDL